MGQKVLASKSKPLLHKNPTLRQIQKYVHQMTKKRGFGKETPQDKLLMLCEEVGELAKAVRLNSTSMATASDSEKHLVRHEAADVLLVLVSLCNILEIDLENALREKEEINKKRVWK